MNVKVVLFKVIIVLVSLVNIVTVKAEEPIGTIRWQGHEHEFYDREGVDTLEWGVVGAWKGTGLVDDARTTYFIGHTPGEFEWMFSAEKGQTITVTDKNGNVKDYEIYKIFKIDNYWYDLDGNDLLGFYEHFNEKPKEEILLQTCQNLDIKLIIVARSEEGKR